MEERRNAGKLEVEKKEKEIKENKEPNKFYKMN